MPTNQALDRLRLAAALTHRLPGARLVLRTANGSQVIVGQHPGDDLDPCQLRRLVVASSVPGAADLGSYLAPVRLTGPDDLGGGLHGSSCEHGRSRWFATLLGPDRARAVLRSLSGAVPDDLLDAGLGVDRQLAVTVVRMTCRDDGVEADLDDLAWRALAACCAEELIGSARQEHATPPATRLRRFRRPDGR